MTTEPSARAESLAFIRHLTEHPEDLRDIRRLQRVYRLSAMESARLLDSWDARHQEGGRTEAS